MSCIFVATVSPAAARSPERSPERAPCRNLPPPAPPHVFGSIHLGRILGIKIRVSWVFVPLLAVLVLASAQGGLTSMFLLASVLGCVLLHELGHALAAQRYGLEVKEIKFWLLGGVAQMSAIPENPRIEGVIALAGPAVNLLLAGLALPLLLIGAAGHLPPTATQLVELFLVVNLALGIFNLLPAFPMDGGRLLRAALATRFSWLRATEIAVKTGRWVALALALFGIFAQSDGLFLLPIIAVYVWWQGTLELSAVRLRHGVNPFGRLFAPFGFGNQGAFGGQTPEQGGGSFEPAQAPAWSADPHTPAPSEPHMPGSGARRPALLDIDAVPRGGLTEREIEALERFPGRLRRERDS